MRGVKNPAGSPKKKKQKKSNDGERRKKKPRGGGSLPRARKISSNKNERVPPTKPESVAPVLDRRDQTWSRRGEDAEKGGDVRSTWKSAK